MRDYLDKATAAFAFNRYAVAAENYEKAFELKPDPAVLYNAAQAHRLAGNKERALDLYQSYPHVRRPRSAPRSRTRREPEAGDRERPGGGDVAADDARARRRHDDRGAAARRRRAAPPEPVARTNAAGLRRPPGPRRRPRPAASRRP